MVNSGRNAAMVMITEKKIGRSTSTAAAKMRRNFSDSRVSGSETSRRTACARWRKTFSTMMTVASTMMPGSIAPIDSRLADSPRRTVMITGYRAMPADHHRSHTRGQEGACRPHRRRARECALLARTAPRSQAAWALDWPRARGRRWCARVLASGRRGMAADPRPALLGAQNRQRPQQTAEQPATESQAGAAGNLDGGDQEGCACRLRRLRRDLGRQIRQGGRVPDQGSRCAARLLQLPGRALEAPAHGVRFRDVNARTRPDRG